MILQSVYSYYWSVLKSEQLKLTLEDRNRQHHSATECCNIHNDSMCNERWFSETAASYRGATRGVRSRAFHVSRGKQHLVKCISITCHKASTSSPLKFYDTLQRELSLRPCLPGCVLAAAVTTDLQPTLIDMKSTRAKYVSV